MIEAILPSAVIAIERRGDVAVAPLHPEESASLGDAGEKRRREFASGRACAHEALALLGVAPLPLTVTRGGEPSWPAGVVGSITHCEGYRACAVARREQVAGLGIDAEPNAALPPGVLAEIASAEEIAWVARLGEEAPAISWDRLLFSAKESLYKAWHPLEHRRLGFADAILAVQPAGGTFSARLSAPGPLLEGRRLATIGGRWIDEEGLLLTAVALPAGR